ncbi:MAG: hypothetical protein QW379_07480 [Thermoplasmata archaeon]
MSERREHRDSNSGRGTNGPQEAPQTLIEALLLSAEAAEFGGYIAVPWAHIGQCERRRGGKARGGEV